MFDLKLPFRPDLVLTDVDGTLMNDQYLITKNTIKTIKEFLALENGPEFGICTGRHPATLIKTVLPIFQKLDPEALHVVCGGSMVIDSFAKILWKRAIDAETVKQTCQQVEKLNASFGFGSGNSFFCGQKLLTRRLASLGGNEGVIDFRSSSEIEKNDEWETSLLVITDLNPEVTAYLKNLAQEQGFSLIEMISVRSGLPYYDLTFPGIDKASGIKELLKLKGMETDKIVMLGDGMNDLAAVEEYFGLAVANAKEELKAVANLILPWTNNQEAVAKVLQLIKSSF